MPLKESYVRARVDNRLKRDSELILHVSSVRSNGFSTSTPKKNANKLLWLFGRKMKSGIKSPAFLTTALLLVVGTLVLMSTSEQLIGALFFVPFALGPLFVSLVIAVNSPYRSCQIILTVGSGLYSAWFGFVFLNAFYYHVDAQSSIALIFIGIFSLPIMIPIWLITLVLRRRNKLKGEQAGGSPLKFPKN